MTKPLITKTPEGYSQRLLLTYNELVSALPRELLQAKVQFGSVVQCGGLFQVMYPCRLICYLTIDGISTTYKWYDNIWLKC